MNPVGGYKYSGIGGSGLGGGISGGNDYSYSNNQQE
jgi:hypothetical protein